MTAAAFLETRDFLLAHRRDYATAYRDFRWPALDRFNWALDYFDPMARGNDRPPTAEEMAACRAHLDEQIRIIEPRIIVTLGASAAKALLGEGLPITKIRGQWREYAPREGAPVKLLPTFHPAALLRDPNLKKDVWTDMKNLRKELESK